MAKAVRRSYDDLKGKGTRGKLVIVGKKALGITKKAGKIGDTVLGKYKTKAISGVVFKIDGAKRGLIWSATDEEINKLKPYANAAIKDINDLKYSPAVKAYVDAYFGLKAPAGTRGMAADSIDFTSV